MKKIPFRDYNTDEQVDILFKCVLEETQNHQSQLFLDVDHENRRENAQNQPPLTHDSFADASDAFQSFGELRM